MAMEMLDAVADVEATPFTSAAAELPLPLALSMAAAREVDADWLETGVKVALQPPSGPPAGWKRAPPTG